MEQLTLPLRTEAESIRDALLRMVATMPDGEILALYQLAKATSQASCVEPDPPVSWGACPKSTFPSQSTKLRLVRPA